MIRKADKDGNNNLHTEIFIAELSKMWKKLAITKCPRRSNQSILKEISPGISLEGMMLKLKLSLDTSCEELTHWKRLWRWEGLGAGEEGDDRGDGWMASQAQWTWVWVNSGRWWWTGRPGVLRFMGVAKSQTQLSHWTELNWITSFKVHKAKIDEKINLQLGG